MRYIGCKLNLLSHIEQVVDDLGIQQGVFGMFQIPPKIC